VRQRWSGQVMETPDGLALIGADPSGKKNVYVVAGDSGMGMTHSVLGGLLLHDLILGHPSAWGEVYDPSRTYLKTLGDYAAENLNVAWQYTDWLTGGDVRSADAIERGQGAVMRRGLHKLAVYRDDGGKLHVRSAVCPHMGCVVHWNGAEKSWDCPCHGSRFTAEGEVQHGPATSGLAPAPESDVK